MNKSMKQKSKDKKKRINKKKKLETVLENECNYKITNLKKSPSKL